MKILEEDDIKVILVVFGMELDIFELIIIILNKENLVDVDEGDDFDVIVEIILLKILKGNLICNNCCRLVYICYLGICKGFRFFSMEFLRYVIFLFKVIFFVNKLECI